MNKIEVRKRKQNNKETTTTKRKNNNNIKLTQQTTKTLPYTTKPLRKESKEVSNCERECPPANNSSLDEGG